jgi:IS30 family transposase
VSRRLTNEEQKRAEAMRADGMTYEAIGKVLGRSKSAVRTRLNPEAAEKSREASLRYHKNNPEGSYRRRKAQRRELAKIKLGRGCADCGYAGHSAALDFDHVHGDKQFNVGQMASDHRPWEQIEAEIAKCEVVCANCHRIRTYERHKGVSA